LLLTSLAVFTLNWRLVGLGTSLALLESLLDHLTALLGLLKDILGNLVTSHGVVSLNMTFLAGVGDLVDELLNVAEGLDILRGRESVAFISTTHGILR